MKIVVLAGGLSPERDVSLSSGALIANALMENGHEVMLLDLYLGNKNEAFPPVFRDAGAGKRYRFTVPEREPDLKGLKALSGNEGRLIGDGVVETCREADKVFLALHGDIGENGKLQALLDIYDTPYTGTGYAGSLLAMDKDLSKRLMAASGIPTPDWRRVDLCAKAAPDLPETRFPCVVKPCGCGSSVGVAMVENAAELKAAVKAAGTYGGAVLVEERIQGREFTVGIMGGEALPPIEIVPKSGFYDYRNKYQPGLTEEICPAEISESVGDLLKAAALKVHRSLGLGYYSRVDFILDAMGTAYCLEANTLPGMTPTSLLPRAAAGISYNALCEKIVTER